MPTLDHDQTLPLADADATAVCTDFAAEYAALVATWQRQAEWFSAQVQANDAARRLAAGKISKATADAAQATADTALTAKNAAVVAAATAQGTLSARLDALVRAAGYDSYTTGGRRINTREGTITVLAYRAGAAPASEIA